MASAPAAQCGKGLLGQGRQERVLHGGPVVDPGQRVKLAVHVGIRVGAQRVLDGLRDGRVACVGRGKWRVAEEVHIVRVGADDAADEAKDSRVLGTAEQDRGPGESPVAEGVVLLVQDLEALVACLLPGDGIVAEDGGQGMGSHEAPHAVVLVAGVEQADEPVPLILRYRLRSRDGALRCACCREGAAEHAEHRAERGDADWQGLLPSSPGDHFLGGRIGRPAEHKARQGDRRVAGGCRVPERAQDAVAGLGVPGRTVPVGEGDGRAGRARRVFHGQGRDKDWPERLAQFAVAGGPAEVVEQAGRQGVRGERPAGQPLAQEPARRARQASYGCREETLPVRDMRMGLDRVEHGEGVPCGIRGGHPEAREDGLGQ